MDHRVIGQVEDEGLDEREQRSELISIPDET
jgi:hypothetical protein